MTQYMLYAFIFPSITVIFFYCYIAMGMDSSRWSFFFLFIRTFLFISPTCCL